MVFILRDCSVQIEYTISKYCLLTELFLVEVLHPVTHATHGWVSDSASCSFMQGELVMVAGTNSSESLMESSELRLEHRECRINRTKLNNDRYDKWMRNFLSFFFFFLRVFSFSCHLSFTNTTWLFPCQSKPWLCFSTFNFLLVVWFDLPS